MAQIWLTTLAMPRSPPRLGQPLRSLSRSQRRCRAAPPGARHICPTQPGGDPSESGRCPENDRQRSESQRERIADHLDPPERYRDHPEDHAGLGGAVGPDLPPALRRDRRTCRKLSPTDVTPRLGERAEMASRCQWVEIPILIQVLSSCTSRSNSTPATATATRAATWPATSSGLRSRPASSSTNAKLVNAWSASNSRSSAAPER